MVSSGSSFPPPSPTFHPSILTAISRFTHGSEAVRPLTEHPVHTGPHAHGPDRPRVHGPSSALRPLSLRPPTLPYHHHTPSYTKATRSIHLEPRSGRNPPNPRVPGDPVPSVCVPCARHPVPTAPLQQSRPLHRFGHN